MPDPDISTFYLAMWQLLISARAPAKPEEEAWAEEMRIFIDDAMTEKTMMVLLEIVLSLPYTVSLDLDDHREDFKGNSAINALYHRIEYEVSSHPAYKFAWTSKTSKVPRAEDTVAASNNKRVRQ
jgi:hypothetical protein